MQILEQTLAHKIISELAIIKWKEMVFLFCQHHFQEEDLVKIKGKIIKRQTPNTHL